MKISTVVPFLIFFPLFSACQFFNSASEKSTFSAAVVDGMTLPKEFTDNEAMGICASEEIGLCIEFREKSENISSELLTQLCHNSGS